MSDIMFNGRTYAENLDYIRTDNVHVFSGGTETLGWGLLLRDALQQEVAGSGKTLDGFFAQFNENNIVDGQNRPTKKPLPRTWEEFTRALRRDYLGDNTPLPPETSANQTFSQAISTFQGASSLVDFQALLAAENVTPDFEEQMKRGFADFLQNYPFKPDGSVGTADEFIKNMMEYFGIISTVFTGGFTQDYADGSLQNVFDAITSYEEVFKTFPAPTEIQYSSSGVPQPHDPSFQEKFVEFYKAYVAEHGYFASGRAFNEWVKTTQTEYELGQRNNHPLPVPGYNGPSRVVNFIPTEADTDPTVFENIIIPPSLTEPGAPSLSGMIMIGNIPGYDPADDTLFFDGTLPSGASFVIDSSGDFSLAIDTSINSNTTGVQIISDAINNLKYTTTGDGPQRRITANAEFVLSGAESINSTLTSSTGGVTIVNTSVTTDASARVLVLNRVFKLISEFIDILQEVAAAQAEYLTFLTQWQKAYTDLISQIQTFTRNDGSIFSYSDADTATNPTLNQERSDANTYNLNVRERLSNLRSVVSDTAKREQSRINQSQDAATQQGQFGTSIIQQFATILGSIYR